MSVSPLFINGEWVATRASKTRDILNPSTLQTLGTTAVCSGNEVGAAVRAAKNAQNSWWKTPGIEKAVLLRKIAQGIRDREKELAELLTQESGKPLIESYDCIDWIAACFEYYAEVGRMSRGNSAPPVAAHQVNFTVKEPYGVVACIVPFNFPLLLLAWKVAPALAAGNTVVCKPPHQNPLSTLLFAKALECLPPGVANVITGDASTGELLCRHPDVDLIAFTGSTDAGRKVAAMAGENLKKVNLELGGIDPFIVFKDADLDVAAKAASWARLLNAGQVCTSSKRIYVEKSIFKEFTEKLLNEVKKVRMGNPMEPDTDLGPLISEEARSKVLSQIAKTLEQGAKLLWGGKTRQPDGLKGYYLEPTVLVCKHGDLPTQEEIFGPVISLIETPDAQTAIEWANDSHYGLGACIYTNNLQTAMHAMENIKAGTFWINDPLTDNDAAPFGGMRWSGVGRELGEEGLDAFREPKHVHMDYVMEAKSFWFPYGPRTRQKLGAHS